MKSSLKNFFLAAGIAGACFVMRLAAETLTEDASVDEGNPYVCTASADRADEKAAGIYERKIKPLADQLLSFFGLLALLPVFAVISAAVWMDDPGPVIFTQKRVGKNKKFFNCHKFRSMKMSAPHDVPTHQLTDPEQYITGVGKFLRRTSLDELPQIWDIFRGKMSVIGPRPALWNQEDLVAERDKYGANDIKPGLTGWAQINGRDELEIAEKAKLDGEYTRILKYGGLKAFIQDVCCFAKTVGSVLNKEGVVEGGTGTEREKCTDYRS